MSGIDMPLAGRSARRRRLIGAALVVLCAATATATATAMPALAQQPTSAQASAIRQACRADFQSHCRGVPTGGPAALTCLQQNAAGVSPSCQQALKAAAGTTGGSAVAVPAAAAIGPHSVSAEGGTALVYQPQVISWPERLTLNTRIAMELRPAPDKPAVLGTVEASFATRTDLATRLATLRRKNRRASPCAASRADPGLLRERTGSCPPHDSSFPPSCS